MKYPKSQNGPRQEVQKIPPKKKHGNLSCNLRAVDIFTPKKSIIFQCKKKSIALRRIIDTVHKPMAHGKCEGMSLA